MLSHRSADPPSCRPSYNEAAAVPSSRSVSMSSNESPRYLVAPEFLYCPIPSQLVPPPLPASKISIATSYLRSCPYVRDPATEGSFLPVSEPKPRASTFAGIRSSDKLARRRSDDRE
ncbi:hypothetical protein TIFTF001_051893 [Ficus carica]|uniref:Uncharacterized protein n=1 Tax=Ficus carica TaxID=3494 RepID=A0AA88EF41_FICCA|nr:hypothetical protein TIFTF001_051893 [Ficus carica]